MQKIFNSVLENDYLMDDYFAQTIQLLRTQGRLGTARNYLAAFRKFSDFQDISDFCMSHLDARLLHQFNDWLRASGSSTNSISFYNRVLRSVYNRAVADGLETDSNPFLGVFTGTDATRKRALDVRMIRRISRLDLGRDPRLERARDSFMFSFYARGMCFVDMAFLREDDILNGVITYRRRKTGTRMIVRMEPCMKEIMSRYRGSGGYVFPFVRSHDLREAYAQYTYSLNRCNLQLKIVGEMAGVPFPLSMLVARHSWATLARNSGIPMAVISAGMGHSQERTTRVYLDALPGSLVDQANHSLLNRYFGR